MCDHGNTEVVASLFWAEETVDAGHAEDCVGWI